MSVHHYTTHSFQINECDVILQCLITCKLIIQLVQNGYVFMRFVLLKLKIDEELDKDGLILGHSVYIIISQN